MRRAGARSRLIGLAVVAVAVAGIAVVLATDGTTGDGDDAAVSADGGDALAYVQDRLAARAALAEQSTGSAAFEIETLADALPNVHHRMNESTPPFEASDVVVRGTVTAVRPGDGWWREPTEEQPDDATFGTPSIIGFDDDRTMWRELVVTVSVDEVVAGSLAAKTIDVRWTLDGRSVAMGPRGANPDPEDPDKVAAALGSLGEVVVLAVDDDRGTLVEPTGILQVDDRGRLDAPFVVVPTRRDLWLGRLRTLDALRAEAHKGERTMTYGQ